MGTTKKITITVRVDGATTIAELGEWCAACTSEGPVRYSHTKHGRMPQDAVPTWVVELLRVAVTTDLE